MTFQPQHASALAKIRAKGSPVTFTLTTPGAHDAATGLVDTPTETTVAGYGLQVSALTASDRRAFDAVGLTPSEALMLLFAATTYGEKTDLGASCLWNGVRYVVRTFGDAVAPDGVPILTRPVIAR